MEISQLSWENLTIEDPSILSETIIQTHKAAQFIAMAGIAYVPNQADDSHTNLAWDPFRNKYVGRWLGENENLRVLLDSQTFSLELEPKSGEMQGSFPLNGKTRQEALEWLKSKFSVHGLDPVLFTWITHYEVPEHSTDKGAAFQMQNPELHIEWARYRTNAEILLNEIVIRIEQASEVRVWPHHFDTGIYIPVITDEKGEVTKSIGIGLATPDDDIPEPYFYINHWAAGEAKDTGPHEWNGPGEWVNKTWTGLILRGSDIFKSGIQHLHADQFMLLGLDHHLDLMNE